MIEIVTFDTRWDEDDHTTMMALRGDVPVGTCMVDYDKNGKALLWNLQVSKSHRQEGIGKMLLDKAVICARESRCVEIHLVWRKCDSPEWVIRWYERNGFDECAFGHGVVEMKKILKDETIEKFHPGRTDVQPDRQQSRH